MLSLIICSRNPDIAQDLKDNIAATIGSNYELCVIDNSNNRHSIFTAYCEGVRRANGDTLCFMHEDLVFHSRDWGIVVTKAFEDNPYTGLFGIVGGQFMPKTPCSYWEGGCNLGEMVQGRISNKGEYKATIEGLAVKDPTDVVAVDGFWMCIKRELFEKISWDDKTYNGFHCYDVDICMQVWQAGYKVQVIPDILIEHKSPGNTDWVYLEQNQRFFKKWENSLPSCHGVQLTHTDIAQRTQMVKQMRGYLRLFLDTERQLNNIQKSKAYRLGKFLLKPFELLKK